MSMTGRCACGAIRYESSVDPVFGLHCHCRDCQRASGGACSSVVVFPAEAVVVEGTPKWYETKADSGTPVRRAFCPECGSPLFASNPKIPLLSVKVASLDDPSVFGPKAEIWTSSAQPWAQLDPALPHFPKNPTR